MVEPHASKAPQKKSDGGRVGDGGTGESRPPVMLRPGRRRSRHGLLSSLPLSDAGVFVLIAVAYILAIIIFVIAGCDRPPGEPAKNTGSGDHDEVQQRVSRLQALPYTGYTTESADEDDDGVVTYDAERCYPGYTLYVIQKHSRADLIDADGRPVHSWQHQPSEQWTAVQLLDDGDLLVVGADESNLPKPLVADKARYVLRVGWSGEVRWKRTLTAHHDIQVLPDGRLLTLTFNRRPMPEVHPIHPVRDDRLTLLSSDGEEIESLSFCELVAAQPDAFPLRRVLPSTVNKRPWIDLFHCNSVELINRENLADRNEIYGPGNVLICSRHQNRVFILNRESGKLIWQWGKDVLSGPHDARLLDNGHILIFDNGVAEQRSRVIELDPLSETIAWTYEAPVPTEFYTLSRGSNQRLPNGNTLIVDSDNARIFEITSTGEIVWDFNCPHKNEAGQRAAIFRARRYERAFVEGLVRANE